MANVLQTVERATGDNPRLSVIWLHGLGADGNDFVPIVPALRLLAPARFVFPHAHVRPVTINQGTPMRAWYDILAFDRLSEEDDAGIRTSQAAINALMGAEIARGFSPRQIILAGFSQGGAMALHTGLRYPETLGGIMVLSAYLPLHGALADERTAANATTPIFMAHGSHDQVLPESLAVESRRLLEGHGYTIEWHSYPMAHTVAPEEVEDISRWLTARQRAVSPP